ncbi:MAG: CBS domain-containing protein, partial [Thermoproteota archaeon]|nr:CBS domain-containing protein [Thermoproteota archaeon]
SPILSIGKDRRVEEAALLMMRNKVRHLLVEDPTNNEVVGIITTTDLARYLRKRMKEITQVATVEDYEVAGAQERQERSSHTSSETLLSEVWELSFDFLQCCRGEQKYNNQNNLSYIRIMT